jgi:hypothetical protein
MDEKSSPKRNRKNANTPTFLIPYIFQTGSKGLELSRSSLAQCGSPPQGNLCHFLRKVFHTVLLYTVNPHIRRSDRPFNLPKAFAPGLLSQIENSCSAPYAL